MLENEKDILLLDGECGLCHRLALFMDLHLAPGVDVAYKPIRSDEAQDAISALPEWKKNADTVYLLRRNVIYIRSSAAIRCLLYLKWYFKVWYPILWLVPLPVRDLVYWIISKNRHIVFKRPDTCSFRID